MTAIDALIYCLGKIGRRPTDGEFCSRIVYDRLGEPHWVAFPAKKHSDISPKLCSESPYPFASSNEPYSWKQE